MKKIKKDISDKELKKLSFLQVIFGRPIVETLEVILILVATIYGFYLGIKIFKDESYNLYWIINYLIIAISSLLCWKSVLKSVFAALNMRINLFLWFSLIFIYYTELSPLHFYYMIPVSFFLVYSISYELDKRFAKKHNADLSSVNSAVLAKRQGFFIYLISYLSFLAIVYYIFTNWF